MLTFSLAIYVNLQQGRFEKPLNTKHDDFSRCQNTDKCVFPMTHKTLGKIKNGPGRIVTDP